jgi:Transglycosylase SLT domain
VCLWQNTEKYNQLKLTYLSIPLIYLALAFGSSAKEAVYLKNGFSMEVDSCQQQGTITVLNTGSGTLELSTDEISKVEKLADPVVREPALPDAAALPLAPEKLLVSAAVAQGIDAAFVRSVAKIESGLRQDAVSHKGARGLMQLMPETAMRLKVNASQADDNALGGAKYLRELLLQYHGDSVLALAAYNAGPGAVAKFGGVPPYAETQSYIVRVLKEYQRQMAQQKSSSAKFTGIKKPTATN